MANDLPLPDDAILDDTLPVLPGDAVLFDEPMEVRGLRKKAELPKTTKGFALRRALESGVSLGARDKIAAGAAALGATWGDIPKDPNAPVEFEPKRSLLQRTLFPQPFEGEPERQQLHEEVMQEELAKERALTESAREQHPYASLAGGAAGAALLAASPLRIGAIPKGLSLIPRALAYAKSGAKLGALGSLLEGPTMEGAGTLADRLSDTATNTAMGGALGSVMGVGGGLLGEGVGASLGWTAKKLKETLKNYAADKALKQYYGGALGKGIPGNASTSLERARLAAEDVRKLGMSPLVNDAESAASQSQELKDRELNQFVGILPEIDNAVAADRRHWDPSVRGSVRNIEDRVMSEIIRDPSSQPVDMQAQIPNVMRELENVKDLSRQTTSPNYLENWMDEAEVIARTKPALVEPELPSWVEPTSLIEPPPPAAVPTEVELLSWLRKARPIIEEEIENNPAGINLRDLKDRLRTSLGSSPMLEYFAAGSGYDPLPLNRLNELRINMGTVLQENRKSPEGLKLKNLKHIRDIINGEVMDRAEQAGAEYGIGQILPLHKRQYASAAIINNLAEAGKKGSTGNSVSSKDLLFAMGAKNPLLYAAKLGLSKMASSYGAGAASELARVTPDVLGYLTRPLSEAGGGTIGAQALIQALRQLSNKKEQLFPAPEYPEAEGD